jgi:hypothetical protein
MLRTFSCFAHYAKTQTSEESAPLPPPVQHEILRGNGGIAVGSGGKWSRGTKRRSGP